MPGRYLRNWTGIGWEQGNPRRKKKIGQQCGGQHVLLNGFPEESMRVSKGLSNRDVGAVGQIPPINSINPKKK